MKILTLVCLFIAFNCLAGNLDFDQYIGDYKFKKQIYLKKHFLVKTYRCGDTLKVRYMQDYYGVVIRPQSPRGFSIHSIEPEPKFVKKFKFIQDKNKVELQHFFTSKSFGIESNIMRNTLLEMSSKGQQITFEHKEEKIKKNNKRKIVYGVKCLYERVTK